MAFKQPLNQTRHDLLSQDPNIKNDSERNTTRSGMIESFGKALGVAATIFPLGRVVRGVQGSTKVGKALSSTPRQLFNASRTTNVAPSVAVKNVPVVGTNKFVKVPGTSSTKQVSYVNPKISMTAEERLRAGYSLVPGVGVAAAANESNKK